ncbi:hypothetical protein AB0I28_27060 [Phytomonospora sp. NPDC050363]|uniref:hypothetical protein n=1 Tax=Phytomonospora sp. NPDC050363 TaxID=3155642 RepID=UPI0033E9F45D
MSRADLRFLLKVIALVGLVLAGGVVAGFKVFGGPDSVAVDCADFAAKASSGAIYATAEPVLERQTSDAAKWCEFSGVGSDGTRDKVRVTVEGFGEDAPSDVDDCGEPLRLGDNEQGCLQMVEGAGTPGSNGAVVRLVRVEGDLRIELEARLSAATLRRVEQLAAGQGVEAFTLADLARFTEAAKELTRRD